MMRLDKLFSNLGILSRSECKTAIKKGRITVNGTKAASADMKVDPDLDEICFDGNKLETASFVYYMLNKPSDTVTANEDSLSPVVFDYIDDRRPDLSAVGRLDKDTTGILLITNDGELNHRLLSSKYHVPKTYEVWIDEPLSAADMEMLTNGMDIGDEKPTLPAKIRVLGDEASTLPANVMVIDDEKPTLPAKIKIPRESDSLDQQKCESLECNQDSTAPKGSKGCGSHVELTITEGRYHQVKRMFARLNKPVIRLHRCGFGPLYLDETLKPGQYRALTPSEINSLKDSAGLD